MDPNGVLMGIPRNPGPEDTPNPTLVGLSRKQTVLNTYDGHLYGLTKEIQKGMIYLY